MGLTEKEEAVQIASKLLDRPYLDPDSDEAIVARQFLRTAEQAELLLGMLASAKIALHLFTSAPATGDSNSRMVFHIPPGDFLEIREVEKFISTAFPNAFAQTCGCFPLRGAIYRRKERLYLLKDSCPEHGGVHGTKLETIFFDELKPKEPAK